MYPETKEEKIPDSIQSVVNTLQNNNLSVFVFNFKRIDNFLTDQNQKKEQELFEVISVLNWLNEKYTENKILWLFSFFSACWTGLQVVMRRPEITDYILFSPPAKVKDFGFIVPCSSIGLIMYESDLPNAIEEITEKLLNKSDSRIEIKPFENINIEKNVNLTEMLASLDEYVKKRLQEDSGKIRKIKRDRRRRKKKKNILKEEKSIHIIPIKELDLD